MKNKKSNQLFVIGQDLHIMNPAFVQALDHSNTALAAMAKQQVEAGADGLDLNLGPVRKECGKDNRRIIRAVQTVSEAVDVPLFVSVSVLNQPQAMELIRGRATVNSITADPATLAANMQQANGFAAQLVVLLVRPGLTPFTVEERLQLAMEVLETAERVGFPLTRLLLDPLFHLRPDPMSWQLSRGMPDIDSVLESIALMGELSREKIRTIAALSSSSQFLATVKRKSLHERLLPLLIGAGLDAVILNCHHQQLMEIATLELRLPQTQAISA